MTVDELSRIANRLRLDVVETVHLAGDGHPGPCMSIADIMAVLFFEEMKLDPNNPHWPERDRFILSKGHACPILYAALARKGYFPYDTPITNYDPEFIEGCLIAAWGQVFKIISNNRDLPF